MGFLTNASISVQALAEFSSVLSRGNTRKGKLPRLWREINAMIATSSPVLGSIVPLDQEGQRRARQIADRSMLGYYDA